MDDKQGWTAGPQLRGTFNILWTCISTLALCVWTAVHPNILCTSSRCRAFVTRLGMMLVAIVFPEIIISAAWRQLKSSQMLRAEMNSLCLKQPKENQIQRPDRETAENRRRQTVLPAFDFEDGLITSQPRVFQPSGTNLRDNQLHIIPEQHETMVRAPLEWTPEQAFFAVMGGFAIEVDFSNPQTQTNTPRLERRLVTTEGVIQLAKLGLIPSISTSEIQERSKADVIAKILVLAQITWFGMQVVGRLAGKLPLTLLEVHTAVHVVCTIGIYLLWLKKPYDVLSSAVLKDPDAKDMGALFSFSKALTETHHLAYTQFQSARVAYWNDRAVRAANSLLDHDPPPTPPVKEALTAAVSRCSATTSGQFVPARVTSKDQLLTNLAPGAQRALEILRTREGLSDQDVDSQNWDLLREKSENFAIREVWGGWSTDVGHEMSAEKGLHFLFNLLYGGGHLAAWASSSFPTSTEKWLWRYSAIILVLMPLWGCLWIGWWKAVSSKWKIFYPVGNGDFDIAVAPFFILLILAYALGRSFLLFESLISLRGLPKGAFATVNWSEYLPHIS
ncbi:hypothetical protein BKA61DRAFT_607629 [Leptodontidium sp. MPI-SDFR-AT-0119]|nr:hypothetical protein BKA61DRAFT_607629 [Leptodontidium sp. MPI-SDFR-AT-0119]